MSKELSPIYSLDRPYRRLARAIVGAAVEAWGAGEDCRSFFESAEFLEYCDGGGIDANALWPKIEPWFGKGLLRESDHFGG